jgi:hypothetical protein
MMLTPYTGFSPSLIQLDTPLDQYGPSLGRSDLLKAVEKHSCINPALPIKVLEQIKAPTREAMMNAARNMNKVELGLLYPGITMTTKAGSDNFPIEAMQLFQFDGEAYKPIGKLIDYEGRTPKL